jgi:glutaminase
MGLKSEPTIADPNRMIPHNPYINSGAIIVTNMVLPEIKDSEKRLKSVLDFWKEMSGGPDAPIGFSKDTYLSESGTADRNWCLAYMMREGHSWPTHFNYKGVDDLQDTMELYFQICSIMSTSKAMSIMSATLANGGLNPMTGTRCCTPNEVRCALPIMLTCGMYDYSG